MRTIELFFNLVRVLIHSLCFGLYFTYKYYCFQMSFVIVDLCLSGKNQSNKFFDLVNTSTRTVFGAKEIGMHAS